MPLRSEPDEAAVGEVFGHLRGAGRGDADVIEIDLKHLRHDLRHLDEQPLPHLGAAVVQHARCRRYRRGPARRPG